MVVGCYHFNLFEYVIDNMKDSMGKRKRRQHGKRRRATKKRTDQGPVFFAHPLNDVPREQLIPNLVEVAKASDVRFHEALESALKILRSVDPLQTITTLAAYGLFGSMSADGEQKPLQSTDRFGQAQVELVQALSLTIATKDLSSSAPDGLVIQQLFDLLPVISESFSLRRMVVMASQRADQHKAVTFVQELLRMHTQNVRNWVYFDKVLRTVNALYTPLDHVFTDHIGLAATQIAAAFLFLIRNSEEIINARWKVLHNVFLGRTVAGMIRRYYAQNPEFEDTAEDLIGFATRNKLTVDQTKDMIIAYSDFRLQDAFRFSASSLANALTVSETHVVNLFKRLSLSLGELALHNLEHLLLDNPVWHRPVIDLGGGEYFCALPQVFFSFVFPILDGLAEGNDFLKRACEDRRAEFLESELAQLFARTFPGAEILPGFRWRDGDTQYQNDLMVRVDSHLLLIEAKSGTVSAPALRGAPERAKKHIQDLFIAPSIQSARLSERIREVVKSPALRTSHLPNLDMQLDQVHTVLRLSVTLQDFATIQSNLQTLEKTGWLPPQHTLAPCILMADLEVVFDILEHPGQILNYLRRRTELTAGVTTMGDELDHLGLYLGTGFNIGDAESNGVSIQLLGMSKEVDTFCMARAEGVMLKKPQPRLSRWWLALCTAVERRAFSRWTDILHALLSLSLNEQKQAEKMFKQVKKNVRTNSNQSVDGDFIMVIPNPRKTVALAFFAFRSQDRGTRHERMQSIASQTFEHDHVAKCLIVGIDIDKDMGPYSTLAMFFREDAAKGGVDDLTVY
jgi:hypothetical protein